MNGVDYVRKPRTRYGQTLIAIANIFILINVIDIDICFLRIGMIWTHRTIIFIAKYERPIANGKRFVGEISNPCFAAGARLNNLSKLPKSRTVVGRNRQSEGSEEEVRQTGSSLPILKFGVIGQKNQFFVAISNLHGWPATKIVAVIRTGNSSGR